MGAGKHRKGEQDGQGIQAVEEDLWGRGGEQGQGRRRWPGAIGMGSCAVVLSPTLCITVRRWPAAAASSQAASSQQPGSQAASCQANSSRLLALLFEVPTLQCSELFRSPAGAQPRRHCRAAATSAPCSAQTCRTHQDQPGHGAAQSACPKRAAPGNPLLLLPCAAGLPAATLSTGERTQRRRAGAALAAGVLTRRSGTRCAG